nr:MAG TPA: hypothetical protein [Caudoviricetes sp.]
MSDEETFARLLYFAVTLLHRDEYTGWLMPFGELLDQIEIYKQMNGISKPKADLTVDDVIPFDV